jgi:catechol 2,3-dioxygenase-like lactoylglutathione lyase family enzyme
MKQSIAHFALLVKDYDEAIAFYTQKLVPDLRHLHRMQLRRAA